MLAQNSAKAFEMNAPAIFRIEYHSIEAKAGTGFSVTRFGNNNRLVLATARHVVEHAVAYPSDWFIKQFDRNGMPTREFRFQSEPHDDHVFVHKKMDLGLLILDSHDTNGSLFSPSNEPLLPRMDERYGLTPGTRVGWAGYPGTAEAYLGHPQLCYCEGVISALIDRDDRRLYLVDGHNAFGISGGPVWHWSDERDRMEIVGVVSGYAQDTKLPGFCMFEPLESFEALFKSWQDYWNAQRQTPGPENP